MAARGLPVIPVVPKSKRAAVKEWQLEASTDAAKITEWAATVAGCNWASVARDDSWWVFDDDAGVVAKYTGILPNTLRVQSSPGHFHYYFQHTKASRALGQIEQANTVG